VFVSVIFTPGTKAPDGSFTKPVMLPVGDAMTQLVHISTNTQRIIHRYMYVLIDFLHVKTRALGMGKQGPVLLGRL